MRLATDKDTTPHATLSDILKAVEGLTRAGKAFLVLNRDDVDRDDSVHGRYLQAAGTVAEEFLVEYRDGGPGDHYRGDRRVSATELVTMLGAYLQGASCWQNVITWHRLRVDQEYPSA